MTELKTGQIWALPAEGGIPPLLVFIHRLDFRECGTIAGVSIKAHPKATIAGWPGVSHLPIDADTVGVSHGKLAKEDAAPTADFEGSYQTWFAEFEEGKAGYFKLSAVQAYAAVVGIVNPDLKSGKEND